MKQKRSGQRKMNNKKIHWKITTAASEREREKTYIYVFPVLLAAKL